MITHQQPPCQRLPGEEEEEEDSLQTLITPSASRQSSAHATDNASTPRSRDGNAQSNMPGSYASRHPALVNHEVGGGFSSDNSSDNSSDTIWILKEVLAMLAEDMDGDLFRDDTEESS